MSVYKELFNETQTNVDSVVATDIEIYKSVTFDSMTAGVLHSSSFGAITSSLIVNGDIANDTIENEKIVTIDGSKITGLIGADIENSFIKTTNIEVVNDAEISGNIIVDGTVDGVDIQAFKNDYDSKVNQSVLIDANPVFTTIYCETIKNKNPAYIADPSQVFLASDNSLTLYGEYFFDILSKNNLRLYTISPSASISIGINFTPDIFIDSKINFSKEIYSLTSNITCANLITSGLVDGVDVSSFKSDYDSKVNQDLRTTASPTFVAVNTSQITNKDPVYVADPSYLQFASSNSVVLLSKNDSSIIGLTQLVYGQNSLTLQGNRDVYLKSLGSLYNVYLGCNGTNDITISSTSISCAKPLTSSNDITATNFITAGLVDGVDISSFKSDYDSKINQNVKTTASPTFVDVTASNIITAGLVDGVDVSSFKSDYDSKINQDLRTSASPTFVAVKTSQITNKDPVYVADPSYLQFASSNSVVLLSKNDSSLIGLTQLVYGQNALTLQGNRDVYLKSLGSIYNVYLGCNGTNDITISPTSISCAKPLTSANDITATNFITAGLVDGVDISSFKSDYDSKINQNVKTTATPTFTNIILTASHASNVFFLEGSWGVTIGDGTNFFTTSVNAGYYTRIGSIVTITIQLIWTSKGAASGSIRVSLPFSVNSSTWKRAMFTYGYVSGVTGNFLLAHGDTNFIALSSINTSTGVFSSLTNTNFSASGEIQLSGSYKIA